MWVSGNTSRMPRATTSSSTLSETTDPSVSNTACPHGFIFSLASPGR